MLSRFTKAFSLSSVFAAGLLVVFAVAVLSCGSSMMPSMPTMHGGSAECSGMFTNTFVITHKELGALKVLASFLIVAFAAALWTISLLLLLISQHYFVRILLRARSTLVRLHDHLLQQFSSGILHPQIY